MSGWQPIETAPDWDRVWVCGWQKPIRTTRGYWWYHEDVIADGKAMEHPEALFWFPIKLPDFPAPPVSA